MASSTTIPRFLLPQRGRIWRNGTILLQWSRYASGVVPKGKVVKKPSKPIVLEKPEKFNPPSHPQRKYVPPRQYPGPKLSDEEAARMKTRRYPHMMPAEGTFMHWFLTSKSVHMYITLSTLTAMAFFVWITNFKENSPFSHMLPPGSQFFFHPLQYTRTFFEVFKLTTEYNTQQTMERRKAKVEDVAKRSEYRKAHGLNTDTGFGSWTAKKDEEVLGSGIRLGEKRDAELLIDSQSPIAEEVQQHPEKRERRPVKKWLGIW